MGVFVCLLRAIGPETHAKMSMKALREGCDAAGLDDVATHGNTGNVICRSDKSAAQVREIVQQVVDGFGIRSEVFVRTPRQMAAVVRANPFPEAARERPAEVGVCSFHKAPRWPDWVGHYEGPQRLATVGAHLIVDYPQNISGNRLDIEKRIGARMTMRNWRVFATLAEKAAALATG
jgi:uncharacterized protein (DUF1697 family)